MFLDRDEAVLRTQQVRCEARRTWITVLSFAVHAVQIDAQGVGQICARGEITNACDSVLGFARPRCLRALDLIQTAARMCVDDAEWLLLAAQVQNRGNQRNMLYDIGKIAGMEDVAVIHN